LSPRQAVDKPHGFVVDWSGDFTVFLGVSQALTMKKNSIVPDEKPSTTLPGIVEKVIKPRDPRDPEKAQVVAQGADHLYGEIRIDNPLNDANGQEIALKPGAPVEVTVAADPEDTVKS
jgi:hypothetical protein